MARRVHFAVERLGDKAQVIVHRALGEKWTDARTVAAVKAETGETIAKSSLARYRAKWQAQNDALRESQEQARAIVAEIAANGITAGDAAGALITQALLDSRMDLAEADPIALAREQRERDKLQLDREKVQLQRDQLEFDRKKFEAMQEERKAIAEKARQAKERVALKPEEAVRLIDELYGLTQSAA